MLLVTAELRRKLLRNGRDRDADQVPVVRIFDPSSRAAWILSQMDPDHPDHVFGLCDLGRGCPELGSVSLLELRTVKGLMGIGLERDRFFRARHPLLVYARAARIAGRIVEDRELLDAAQAAIVVDAPAA